MMELLIRTVVVGAWCGERVACEVGIIPLATRQDDVTARLLVDC